MEKVTWRQRKTIVKSVHAKEIQREKQILESWVAWNRLFFLSISKWTRPADPSVRDICIPELWENKFIHYLYRETSNLVDKTVSL